MRKLITIYVVFGMATIVYSFEETLDIYEYSIGGTISYDHTYDHSADPILWATLTIVADDVDGPGGGMPPDGEQDMVWIQDSGGTWHELGYLNNMDYYTNWNYWPGPGNPDHPDAITTTTFFLDPSWLDGLPVEVRIEAWWGLEIETSTLTVVQIEVIDVTIDIKPGSDPNPINQGSNGLVPVAIFSSPEFDATQVDPTSVYLAGASVAVRGTGKSMAHEEDVNGDGLVDLVVQVETQSFDDLGAGGTVELTGTTFSGEDIVGYDEVVIVPPVQ